MKQHYLDCKKVCTCFCFIAIFCIALVAICPNANGQTFNKDQHPEQYYTLSVGVSFGNFENQIIHGKQHGDFWDIFDSWYETYGQNQFKHSFGLFTVGYSKTKIKRRSIFTFRFSGSVGGITETNTQNGESTTHGIFTINPNLRWDLKWMGIGLGFHFGNNSYALSQSKFEEVSVPETGLGHKRFLPQFHFRFGPKRFLFVEYNFADQFPNALPSITHQYAIGSGFGAKSGFYIKFGGIGGSTAQAETEDERIPGEFISAYVPINDQLVFEPFVGFGSHNHVYLVGFHYRFRD